jgi:hypothetical protein
LRRGPAEIGSRDRQAGDDFHRLAEALAIEIADRQQIHAVERARKEERNEQQAERRAERIRDDAPQAVAGERRGYREHRFGAEPRREHGRCAHVERQASTGEHEIPGVVHPPRRPQADDDRQHQVEDD